MAISQNLIDATTAAVATAGTSVAPATVPPDNCHTMVVLNESTSNTLLINFGSSGGALSQDTSVNVLPQTSLSLAIGSLSQRAASGANVIFDATGNSTNARIFYLNGITA